MVDLTHVISTHLISNHLRGRVSAFDDGRVAPDVEGGVEGSRGSSRYALFKLACRCTK